MKFYTAYVRPEKKNFEFDSGRVLVERTGYIPAKIQIENLILAGQRLADYRREKYDFEPGSKEDFNYHDPTRDPNFDMSDASQITQSLESKAKAYNESQNAKKSKKDEKKLDNPSDSSDLKKDDVNSDVQKDK